MTTAEPEIPLAQLQLGVARVRQRQYALAIAPLAKAAALQPEQMTAHYELGVALYETGDLRAAATHFEMVAAKMPDTPTRGIRSGRFTRELAALPMR